MIRLSHKLDALGVLLWIVYVLLTLVPDSGTILLSWPWVMVGQLTIFIPWLWLLKQSWQSKSITVLGIGLDLIIILAVLGVLGACFLSPFPQQAIWGSWGALGAVASIYAVNTWCQTSCRRTMLLSSQAVLVTILILISLLLWSHQTLLPELSRLQALRENGLDLAYDFSKLELRNWAPFGHQNYVAGYLVLGLPLLIGQCLITEKMSAKILWGLSIGLGFFTLFTTSSRGGWLGLGLGMSFGIGLLILNQRLSIWLRLLPVGALGGITAIALVSNNRLRNLVLTNPLANGSLDPYRQITNTIGWAIGQDFPVFGAGPGNVPLLFQKYRPAWGGLEAEWHHQLHSTPAQIWAEFGGIGIIVVISGIMVLTVWSWKFWRSPTLNGNDRVRFWCLLTGLVGYGIVSLTDYQLNIIAISGTLILYLVCLLSFFRENIPQTKPKTWSSPNVRWIIYGAIGFLIAMSFWLAPILKAWQLSSTAFNALKDNQFGQFVQSLERSHQLAPWEPYYLYQLGLHTGKAGLNIQDADLRKQLLDQSQSYFEASVQVSPYQEYGWSNLGWHLMKTESSRAVQTFSRASQIFPGRILAFHELGLSLLELNQPELATQSFALEIIRNPLWMTSPIWKSQALQPFYSKVLEQVETFYVDLLQTTDKPSLKQELHQALGGLYWWQGNSTLAKKHWTDSAAQLGLELLDVEQNNFTEAKSLILQAWLNPKKRSQLVEKAYLFRFQNLPNPKKIDALVKSMNQATSLENWLKEKPLVVYGVRTRTGFGINAGHIDGPPPQDFSGKTSNYVIATFFSSLFEMPIYEATLDQAIQPLREELWRATDTLTSNASRHRWQTEQF